MRTIALTSAALLAITGCTAERIVNTGEWETDTATSTSLEPPLPPTNPAHLPNAFDFVQDVNGTAAYYFSTPSGRWQCAILPRDKVGCTATSGGLGIAGAPETVPNSAGQQVPTNALVIEPQGDPHFAALDPAPVAPPAPANVLPFNRTLIVARFRCNIQEAAGVSCLSEESGKGFTFSADGYLPQYTEVPLDAP
ncbi:hypothetical protein A5662_10830 [Mycobacteriaceae bacterium 1482268.1]|nr:hypothetical protein A5662_10830 [Mycobacteriaceae bacterium 1482268.1]